MTRIQCWCVHNCARSVQLFCPLIRPSQALSCHSELGSGRVQVASFSVQPRAASDREQRPARLNSPPQNDTRVHITRPFERLNTGRLRVLNCAACGTWQNRCRPALRTRGYGVEHYFEPSAIFQVLAFLSLKFYLLFKIMLTFVILCL